MLATRECGPDIFILLFMFDISFVSFRDVPTVSNIYECRNFGDNQVPFATKCCYSSITQLMQQNEHNIATNMRPFPFMAANNDGAISEH